MEYEESDYYLLLGSSIFINFTIVSITLFFWRVIWLQYSIHVEDFDKNTLKEEFQINSFTDAWRVFRKKDSNLILN